MAVQTSKQLFARRQELAANQASLMAEGLEDEARVVEGQIREIDRTLDHVLDEEEKLRNEYQAAPAPTASFGERILGPRDAFDSVNGLKVGFRNEDDGDDYYSGDTTPGVVHVAGPQEIDYSLPSKDPRLLYNFAATLPSAPAKGPVTYKRRSTQYGEPGTWEGIDPETGVSATKPKIIYTWQDVTANKETTAGYVPVSKDTLKDYDELLAIIEHDLLLDLDEKVNTKYLTGNNSNGIVGVLNTVGIQAFTTHMGGLYWEAIRHMRNEVMKNARKVPTHVCMHPDIKLAIDLYKTQQGYYQSLGNDFWGMIPVEDFDCAGILVYDKFSARKRPIHGRSVEVGYVNDQFIKNELSLLAEETDCLQVIRPDAFMYATKTNLDAS